MRRRPDRVRCPASPDAQRRSLRCVWSCRHGRTFSVTVMSRYPLVVVVMAALAAAGCGSVSPDADAASQTALTFHTALSNGDGSGACAMLAPSTLAQFEKTTKAPCAVEIIEESPPAAGAVSDVRAYGRAAQVRMDADTVFLTTAGGGWKVAAAGCRPQPDEPYNCAIEGP